jgi:hypothetical protein
MSWEPDTRDLELVELLQVCSTDELAALEYEFQIFAAVRRSRLLAWARFWRCAIQKAAGFDIRLPEALPVEHMTGEEREAIKQDLEALAERHRYDDGIVEFACAMAAQIDFAQLDAEAQKQDLQAQVDAYRRAHPYGVIRPPGDAP